MKEFQDFCREIAEQAKELLGEGYETVLKSVQKNNNVTMEGLLIRYRDANVVPTIYLDPFYEQYLEGRTMEHVVEDVVEMYKNNRLPWKQEPSMRYADIKDRIQFKLMNLPLNRDMLSNMPHVEIGDLAVGFQWTVDTDDRRVGTVRITDDQAATWGVTTEELTELALRNSARDLPPVLRSIEDVLLDILNASETAGEDTASAAERKSSEEARERFREGLERDAKRRDFPMYVLSNSDANGGAAALLELPFLNEFRDSIGDDFWILPSSIHEVILVPVSKIPDRERLTDMVREINRTQVPKQEFLSDMVYRFSEFESLMPAEFRDKLMAAG
ncbi:MAG: hypothetical protein J5645_02270 [Lachnospiraceae bacterium]|nr:hypothetical protein [Lachnospiraceae bacterium]